jgi:hypothetical protein
MAVVGCELLFSGTFPLESVDVGSSNPNATFREPKVPECTASAFFPYCSARQPQHWGYLSGSENCFRMIVWFFHTVKNIHIFTAVKQNRISFTQSVAPLDFPE